MAKKFRKLLAVLLTLTILAGQLAVPTVALEADPLSAPGGAPAVDPATGNITTSTTEVQQSGDPATGNFSESTQVTTLTTDQHGNVLAADVQREWTEQTTEGTSTTQEGTPPAQVDNTVVTDTQGTESTVQSITSDGTVETVKGEQKGEETTTVTDTTVTTTVEENKEFSSTDSSDTQTSTTDVTTTETIGTPEKNEEQSAEGQWETTGGPETVSDNSDNPDVETTTEDLTPVIQGTLELTPGGTDEDDITLEEALGDQLPDNAAETGDGYENVIRDDESSSETVTTTTNPDLIPGSAADPALGTTQTETVTTDTYVAPTGYTVGSVTNGNETVETQEIKDENGNVIGLRYITTTVTENTVGSSAEATGSIPATESAAGDTFTLPEKPAAGTVTDDFGFITTTTVEDVYENGVHVGYKAVTVTTDSEGNEMSRSSQTTYGTSASASTRVERDPETEVETVKTTVTSTSTREVYNIRHTESVKTTDQRQDVTTTTTVREVDEYEFVNVDGKTHLIISGQMYEVVAVTDGQMDLTSVQPDANYIGNKKNESAHYSGTDLRDKNNTADGLFEAYSGDTLSEIQKLMASAPEGYDYQYVGNGQASNLYVQRYGANNTYGGLTNHQFALRDADGNLYYAYCADMATSAVAGKYYKVENLEDQTYYQGENAVDHIKAVIMNGYWGGKDDPTDPSLPETLGTLQDVKDLLDKYAGNEAFLAEAGLTKKDLEDAADSITMGEALSATQAAVWKFGNNDSQRHIADGDYPAGFETNENDTNEVVKGRDNVQALYKLLISNTLMKETKKEADTATNILDTTDVLGATLEVNGKADIPEYYEVTADPAPNFYNTDLTLSLAVKQSKITGNMVIQVMQGGKVIRTEQIATNDSNLVGKLLAGTDNAAGGSDFTIKDLVLAEGIAVDLVLDGYQNLEEGVYLYVSETNEEGDHLSQTFVGVAKGTQDVYLKTGLEFHVEDPQVRKTKTVTTTTKVEKTTGQLVSLEVTDRADTKTTEQTATETKTDTNVTVYGDETTTVTQTKVTRKHRDWQSYYEYLLTTVRDEDGGGDDDGGKKKKKTTTILDEDVALADAARTGDISGLWAAISAASLAGMAVLSFKRKEEDI